MLANHFQGWKGFLEWKGTHLETKYIHCGAPKGGFFGILEYLSQSNDNSEIIDPEEKLKFVDNLTALELLSLQSVWKHRSI